MYRILMIIFNSLNITEDQQWSFKDIIKDILKESLSMTFMRDKNI